MRWKIKTRGSECSLTWQGPFEIQFRVEKLGFVQGLILPLYHRTSVVSRILPQFHLSHSKYHFWYAAATPRATVVFHNVILSPSRSGLFVWDSISVCRCVFSVQVRLKLHVISMFVWCGLPFAVHIWFVG